ncbi:MAG: metal ABC transporter substrate-binding protein [Verrucomicrobia bacterium]|nr:metal ABC transporter substrate-binding protein [Verrucomicrobiota bacterium]
MKQFLVMIMTVVTVWVSAAHVDAGDKIRVVATIEDLACIARDIGGDAVMVTAIAGGAQDPHFLDAKPSYLVQLNRADVLIENGGELEVGWLPVLVNGARNRKILPGSPGRVTAMNGIAMLEVPTRLSRAEGDVHPYGNPHFTTDPANAEVIAQNICAVFCAVVPTRTAKFRANLVAFKEHLDAALKRWQGTMAPVHGMKIVTYHKTFSYFARRFGLEVVGTIEAKPGVAPSPGYLAELVAKMKAEGVKLVLAEPFRDLKVAQFAADKSGAKLLITPSGVGGNADGRDLFSYFDWLTKTIVAAAK